jgi:two-component system LytT family sensor kinase
MRRGFIALLHAAYWAIYVLLLAAVFALLRVQSAHRPSLFTALLLARIALLLIAPNVLAFYISDALLFPRLLARRRIGALVAFGTIVCVSAAAFGALLLRLSFGPGQPVFTSATELAGLLGWFSMVAAMHVTVALGMRGFVGWYGDITVKEELGRKSLEVELALLRSKIDPHFLFNTLNNIDVLITRDPAAASAYLNKLSDIMRFVLYETETPRIALAAELESIAKYIDLQRLRSAHPGRVRYETAGDPAGLGIAPMIFIPFVENAFKHAESVRGDDAISIRIEIVDGGAVFHCSNRHDGEGKGRNRGGLGNELIRRRLELLYPERHRLEITDHDARYTVLLSIDLDSNLHAHHDKRALHHR